MLAKFEREAGLVSRCVTLSKDRFGFVSDEVLFAPDITPWQQERRRLHLLGRALRDFDIVHFNFGQTILEYTTVPRLNFGKPWAARHNLLVLYRYLSWMADLTILRSLKKVIVMTYQGDDARQGDYCRSHFDISLADHVDYYSLESDEWKRRAIRRISRYADRIYALNPDLLHVLSDGARFLPYANVDPFEWTCLPPPANNVPLVLHAPSHRGAKGTEYLIKAVKELQSEGIPLELLIVENMTHDEVRRLYEGVDLVVDQLVAGWYGGFAVEAMCLGKPVVSYIRRDDLRFLPQNFINDLPIIDATPGDVKQVLRDLLDPNRRSRLVDLGRRARRFAETWHDPRKIAAQIVRDYEQLFSSRRRFGTAWSA